MWIFRFLTVIETKLITGGDPRGSEALLCCPTDHSTQVVFINIRLLCLLFEHILRLQILFWFMQQISHEGWQRMWPWRATTSQETPLPWQTWLALCRFPTFWSANYKTTIWPFHKPSNKMQRSFLFSSRTQMSGKNLTNSGQKGSNLSFRSYWTFTRFLEKCDGGVRLVKREQFVPFGFGRRVCMGEALAKDTLLIFFATLVKQLRSFFVAVFAEYFGFFVLFCCF